MESQYKRLNNITGWLVWLIASVVYISTIESTVSFWDCGEFIAAANKLQVGHPPGAPLWLMIARAFSTFAGENVEIVAWTVNVFSALCSSFTILFLFWSITALGKKVSSTYGELTSGATYAILISGAIGGLAYTFSDSFWFSAVEAEVYAASSLFTAAVFWVILKWDANADKPYADRYLILVCYLMGLSIGVHILNLLAIPALVYVYYFKRFQPSVKGFFITGIAGIAILGIVNQVIISSSINWATKFELFFVNSVGMPYNSGLWIFIFLLVGGLIFGVYYAAKKKRPTFQNAMLGVLVILIGYSSYSLIVIRSAANPPMDENNPENILSLLPYLNREQYGDRPLMYGQSFSSTLDIENPYLPGSPVYYKPENSKVDKYLIADKRERHTPNYDSKTCMVLPRMYSGSNKNHVKAYKSWSGFEGKNKVKVKVNKNGRSVSKKVAIPSFKENWTFFFNYQFNFMYWRYFMWNFTGRQNDTQGHGLGSDGVLKGNWISGIDFIDNDHVGDQSTMPSSIKDSLGRNAFYFLPLILGIIGLIFHFTRHAKDAFVVLLMFFMTGLAIIIYLNQTPYQPRERDYAYAGSFYAFAIWIGLGAQALYYLMRGVKTKDEDTKESNGIENKLRALGWFELSLAAVSFFALGIIGTIAGYDVVGKSLLYIGAVLGGILGFCYVVGSAVSSDKAKAVLVLLVTAVVPYLMADQGWDDHTRNNRYTARDFAKNYLASCDKDAIIFTNGDNDTFPLWYVQEVEGYRTDVRIVNLSLLNTDWYIDQMKRAAYDAKPVPFSLTQDQYRQGTRDYLFVQNVWDEGYHNITKVMDFIKSENPGDKIPLSDGSKVNYFPTTKFTIDVDKENVIKSNGVLPQFEDKIPESINWSLRKKSTLMKANIMILDLLATNNWERPVYFAITVGKDHYMNLQSYFQLEGLAYKMTPIKYPEARDGIGYINTEKMYNLLMDVDTDGDGIGDGFKWGNMEVEDVYVDEQIRRMCTNYRDNFARLARKLIEKGENDKARELLDRCMELMPKEKVPYNFFTTYVADAYFKLGDEEKGKNLMLEIATQNIEELEWYYDQIILSPSKYLYSRSNLYSECGKTEQYLSSLQYFASTHHNIEKEKDAAQEVVDYVSTNLETLVEKKAAVEQLNAERQKKSKKRKRRRR